MNQFERFIHERKYLKNVSPRTLGWYAESFKWLVIETPTDDDLKSLVIRMREAGLKATSCNNRIRAVNAYLKWAGSPLHVSKLKEPSDILPTFKPEDIAAIAIAKVKTFHERRTILLMLTLIDSGCRIDEVLSLRWSDIDFDNLLILVRGKGDKQRRIPFSFELRRHLIRFRHDRPLVFSTLDGRVWCHSNAHRSVKLLCVKLGVVPPRRLLHAFRHTFATNYIRSGGSAPMLQRVLGHTTIAMTMKYVHVQTEDLQANHERVSLLGGRR